MMAHLAPSVTQLFGSNAMKSIMLAAEQTSHRHRAVSSDDTKRSRTASR